MKSARAEHGLPYFRRAMRYMRPHRRPLVMGLLAAVGVSIFYTFSVSSIVPVLKILFAEHESLVDWLHRAEAERRLGAVIAPDLPDDPRGLALVDVRPGSPAAGTLRPGDRFAAVDGHPGSAYALAARLALVPADRATATLAADDGPPRTAEIGLRPHRWWWPAALRAAAFLPTGRTAEDRFGALLVILAGLVVVALLGGIFRFINEGLVAAAVQQTMHDLRTRLAEHALRLPMDWHGRQAAGDTLSRFATDLGKVEVGLSTLFGKMAREPLKALGVLSLTILLDWHMLVVALLGLPFGLLAIRTFGRLVKRAQKRASQSWGRLLDHLGERLAGIRVVKAYGMEGAEAARFEREGRILTRAQTNIELVDAASNPVLEMLATLAISAFILYGGSRVFRHELEPHLLFGAVICLGGIFDPLRKMGNVNNRLQAAEASAKRLFEIMDLAEEGQSEKVRKWEGGKGETGNRTPTCAPSHVPTLSPAALRLFRERIEFRDVSFAYPSNPERLVLDGIRLDVCRGQVVALVGGNGSGKTTLMSLLLRFFEPTAGRILIDGQDIAGVALDSLRAQIGLVTQDAVVFSDTVHGNIAYGANGVTEDQVRRAAALAHVDDFIRDLRVEADGDVTHGYAARISGRTLSGGQRQRIVLARAILRDPPILILDEATSQVDSESEQKIQQALEDVTRDRTTFIIAHRFSTIARADWIVVLDAGRIVAQGRHAELLASCPFYETLVRTQFAV